MRPSRLLPIVLIVFAIEAVVVIWIFWSRLTIALAERGYIGADSTQLGTWGDSYGVLSSFFTALGFIGVIAGFLLQLRQMRSAQEEQHRQRFDNWFFRLLALLRESRDAVRFRNSQPYTNAKATNTPNRRPTGKASAFTKLRASSRPTFEGVEAFKAAWFEANFFIQATKSSSNKNIVIRIYDKFVHSNSESVFGPYFRLLYTILEGIDSDPILSMEDKYRYGRLLRSQLTTYETTLAGINGLSEISKDLDKLIVKFRLLKYIPPGTRKRLLENFYPPETFMARD